MHESLYKLLTRTLSEPYKCPIKSPSKVDYYPQFHDIVLFSLSPSFYCLFLLKYKVYTEKYTYHKFTA